MKKRKKERESDYAVTDDKQSLIFNFSHRSDFLRNRLSFKKRFIKYKIKLVDKNDKNKLLLTPPLLHPLYFRKLWNSR